MTHHVVYSRSGLVRKVETGMPAQITVNHKITGAEVNRDGARHGAAVLEIHLFRLFIRHLFRCITQSRIAGGLVFAGQVCLAQVAVCALVLMLYPVIEVT